MVSSNRCSWPAVRGVVYAIGSKFSAAFICTCLVHPQKVERVIKHFLGLVSEYQCANQIHTMWLACDYHATLRYSQLLLCVRAGDALPCQNDVLS